MRILMISISDVLFDGRAQRAAEALAGGGHHVELLGFTREAGLAEKYRQKNPRYRLLRLRLETLGRLGRMLDRFLFSAWALLRLLFASWEVIHLHEPHFLPVARFAAKLRGARLVYDVRELYQGRFGRETFEGRVERNWQKSADAIAITSKERQDVFFSNYDRESRPATVVRNLPRLRSAARRLVNEAGPDNLPRFVYHGRLSRANRHLEEMLLAFRGLDAWLHIMGADSQGTLADLKAMAETEKLNNVSFHEPCAPEELIAICEGIDGGIMPYRDVDSNTALANPTKMAEYAGAGMALIGSDFPLMREAIASHGVGLISSFDNPDALRALFADLIDKRENLAKMKSGSRAWYLAECDWEKEAQNYLDLYKALE